MKRVLSILSGLIIWLVVFVLALGAILVLRIGARAVLGAMGVSGAGVPS